MINLENLFYFLFQNLLEVLGMNTREPPLNLYVLHETQTSLQSLLHIMHTCMIQNTTLLSLSIITGTSFLAVFVVALFSQAYWLFPVNHLATVAGVCSITGVDHWPVHHIIKTLTLLVSSVRNKNVNNYLRLSFQFDGITAIFV